MHLDYMIECNTVQLTHMHAQLIKPGPLVQTHNVKSRLADCCIVLIDNHANVPQKHIFDYNKHYSV